MIKNDTLLILTCEHASCKMPTFAKELVPEQVLKTHRGYDIGAAIIFKKLQKLAKPDFCAQAKYSRLFVDLNRSLTNKAVFSEYYSDFAKKNEAAREYAQTAKARAICYWKSYRSKIEAFIDKNLNSNILHLAIHSFTPILDNKIRNTEIGILYDPSRKLEAIYAKEMKDVFSELAKQYRVRFNYPYLGKSDGLTTALRKKYSNRYIGLEIEINQKLLQ